jgi:hypothetical protein
MRLVITKNSGPPEITAHLASTPVPWEWPEQRPEHLDDAAALCGRVRFPDDLTVKVTSTVGDQIAQRLELAKREHRLEARRIDRFDRYVSQGRHTTPLPSPLPLLSTDPRTLPRAASADWAAATRAIGSHNASGPTARGSGSLALGLLPLVQGARCRDHGSMSSATTISFYENAQRKPGLK